MSLRASRTASLARRAIREPHRILPFIRRQLRERLSSTGSNTRVVVYTVITDGYDDVPSVASPDPEIEWFCFSNDSVDPPEPWQLVPIDGYFRDSKLTSGYLKTNPHLLFPTNTIAVWVDANLDELHLESAAMAKLIRDKPVAMPSHRERDTVANEARVVAELGLDDETRISRLTQELHEAGYTDDQGLSATMLVVRDLSDPAVHRANAVWWDGIARLSRRDQLTVNYALWSAGIAWQEIPVDYREPNELFFRRPHRNPKSRRLASASKLGAVAEDAMWMRFRHTALPPRYPPTVAWHRETWDDRSTALLRELNAIVAASSEAMEGNYCHHHRAEVAEHTPPDIRRSWKREFLRRAAASSRQGVEVGFNAGHSAAVLLGANPTLNLLSIDIGEHEYSGPCANAVAATYPDRFDIRWGDSALVLPELPQQLVESLDFVHIDGGHGDAAIEADLSWFLGEGPRRGCLLVVDDAYVERIQRALQEMCAAGLLEEVLPGFPSSGGNRLYRKIAPTA